ncbi:helix-turn-helix transcriptional regulator [Selenomonas sp.]|uniref:helix-turn-helix domain-containing protein n=1 Tax=Selenomonas sp. TaxID=2053611 RepID=UPI0025EECCC8|nr:helix-turn-helix transcriptional regulator [Selenomonas sp.]MCI6284252.1 helix-turn-helix domain-containing protein [Selenomonas sp.]
MIQETCDIGRRIYDLRIERDVQQGELARAIHLNQSVLNRIEKGTRPARDIEIRAIAMFFRVSTDFLLGLTATHYHAESTDACCVRASGVAETPAMYTVLSPEEDKLLHMFRTLDSRGRRTVQGVMHVEQAYLQAI